jgi:ribosomal RNA-processing protein 8
MGKGKNKGKHNGKAQGAHQSSRKQQGPMAKTSTTAATAMTHQKRTPPPPRGTSNPSSSSSHPLTSAHVATNSSNSKGKLSALQLQFKKKLEGARFRTLNEKLYTCRGEDAFGTFQAEPELFDVVSIVVHCATFLFNFTQVLPLF